MGSRAYELSNKDVCVLENRFSLLTPIELQRYLNDYEAKRGLKRYFLDALGKKPIDIKIARSTLVSKIGDQ